MMVISDIVTAEEIASRFAFGHDLIQQAGAMALRYFASLDTLEVFAKADAQDVVSIADRDVEQTIRRSIRDRFPDDGLLGEEFGLEPGRSGFDWVIDPIDGTSCFVHGLKSWCVSIAVRHGGETVLGLIFDPNADELFTARRDGGAALNGRAIHVDPEGTLATGLTGIGVSLRVPGRVVTEAVARLLDSGGIFIRNGSGALMLAHVACGRLVAYYEPHINAWDCLAGLLIIAEAGGWTADFPGHGADLLAGGPVLAAAPRARAAIEVVAALGRD